MSTPEPNPPAMNPHQLQSDVETIKSVLGERDRENDIHRIIVAAGNFVSGGLLLVAVPFLLLAIGIVGVAAPTDLPDGPPPVLVVGGTLGIVILVIALFSLPFLLAGWGVLKRRSWGPTLALIAGILNLFNVPLGTALGVYTIWAVAQRKLPSDGDPR